MVIGYNHDILHRGRVYHVQTEDSGKGRGRGKGHIFTHVFHAGTIVASHKLGYDGGASVPHIIELLRASHKSMLRRLVQGSFDEAIMRCVGFDGRQHEPSARLLTLIEMLDMDSINRMLEDLRSNVSGALAVALVDYESGMCLGTAGTGLNIEVAAAGTMEVMKAKARVMRDLGIEGGIEDILITLDSQYHIIRPVGSTMFFYLALDRKLGNLALARHKLAAAGAEVKIPV